MIYIRGLATDMRYLQTNRAGRGHLGNTEAEIHMTWANYMVDSQENMGKIPINMEV